MSNYRVYCISSNGNNYVGQTRQEKDWARITPSHPCFKLYDLDKDNFTYKILEYCKSQKELNEREIFWIKEMNGVNKQSGTRFTKNDRQAYFKFRYQRDKVRLLEQMKTPHVRERQNLLRRDRNLFQKTWGGDKRFFNNLLCINIDLFK
tara:strand:- start:41 stop:487 length:447 start_codon:yes stop_codon:yes gene_type:complete